MANLTTKELAMIEDQLTGEENLIRKCKMYADQAQDQALKNRLEDVAKKHQQHYDKLYNLL